MDIYVQQQIEQTERDAQLLERAFDLLRSSIDQPAYAEEVEDGFEDAEEQVRRRYYDPLILDLDGDGIELTAINDLTVRFDIDGDGFREATGWVKPHDGFLVYDRNGDGYINDISELFGNPTTSGFTELQELDSNNDGQITAADANFADLQIWRDLDQDGYSDVQELFTLQEYSISRINAVGNSVSINNEGNQISETASFEFADGTQHQVANVLFDIDQQNSFYDPYSTFNSQITITQQILSLPNLRGYGNLPDLRIAIAKDSELQALVESFTENVNTGDVSAARELIRPILLLWAGVDGVDSSSGNSSTFAGELEFLEKFVGRSWNNTNPSGAGIQTIRNTFTRLASELESRLLVQVVESSVGYNTTWERYEFRGDINEAVEQFKQVVTGSQTDLSQIRDFEAIALAEFIQQSADSNNWIFSVSAKSEDVTLEILATDLVGTDSDLDTSNLSFSGINDAINGTAIVNAEGNIEFTPVADFNGIALIEYTITDGAKTFTGLARVNVAPVNDAPIASNDTATTEEDAPITILAADLLGNDSDVDRDTLSISSVDNAINGTAIVNADGDIEFTPDANFSGTATIDYTVSDGIASNTAAVEITVNSINDAPVANNDTAAAINEDTSITISAAELLGNDSDVEGDSLSITSVNSDSGTATLNAEGQIEFTPNANFNGIATFDYTVSDGTDSSTASVEVTVNAVNDPPIVDKPITSFSVTSDAPDSRFDLNDVFRFVDGEGYRKFSGSPLSSLFSPYELSQADGTLYLTLGYQGFRDFGGRLSGSYDITLSAFDLENNSVESTFTVTVVKADDNPNLLTSADGDDYLNGQLGNDTLIGDAGNDTLIGGGGNDSINGGDGDDNLLGESSNDTIDGGAGNDRLDGGSDNDILFGNAGNDILLGGTGNDTLKGGGGDDLYVFNLGYGNDVISDYSFQGYAYSADRIKSGGANDKLVFGEGITRDNLRWNFNGKDLSFTLTDSPGDRLTVKDYYNSIYRIENIEVEGSQLTKEEIIGLQTWQDTSEVNILDWSETAISFKGLDGNDTITTGEYNDKIWGGAGNDHLNSGFGNDTLYGGLGNDTLYGGEGIDWLLEFGDVDYVLTDNSLTGRGNDSFSQIELVRLQGGAGNNKIDAGGCYPTKCHPRWCDFWR